MSKGFRIGVVLLLALAIVVYALPVGAVPPPRDIVATDGDLDGVYFAGQTLSFDLVGFPADSNLTLEFIIFSPIDSDIYSVPVITGLEYDDVGDVWYLEVSTDEIGSASVSGTVNTELPLGYVIISVPEVDQGFVIQGNAEFNGESVILVGLPTEFGDFSTNFGEINLMDESSSIIVTVSGLGSITFAGGQHPLFYAEAFVMGEALEVEWISITYDSVEKKFSFWVDTALLEDLADIGATIRIYGLAARLGVTGMTSTNFRNYLSIQVYDNDDLLVADVSGYFNLANVTYDPATDILTIPVNHFSEYEISLRELPATGTYINWLWASALVLLVSGLWMLRRRLIAS